MDYVRLFSLSDILIETDFIKFDSIYSRIVGDNGIYRVSSNGNCFYYAIIFATLALENNTLNINKSNNEYDNQTRDIKMTCLDIINGMKGWNQNNSLLLSDTFKQFVEKRLVDNNNLYEYLLTDEIIKFELNTIDYENLFDINRYEYIDGILAKLIILAYAGNFHLIIYLLCDNYTIIQQSVCINCLNNDTDCNQPKIEMILRNNHYWLLKPLLI
jgi:hypothetical protein